MNSAKRQSVLVAVFMLALLWGLANVNDTDARLWEDNFIPAQQFEPSAIESDTTGLEYEVKRGDSLWRIAQIYKVDMQALAAANNLNLNSILKIGQVLQIPVESGPSPPGPCLHLVQPGQTIWRIAQLYGVSIETILQANGMNDPSSMRLGQHLVIPGGGKATNRVASNAVATESQRQLARMSWPIMGVITSRYGSRRGRDTHHGIDIAANLGDPIRAARGGRVVFAGWRPVYGRTVIIDHGDGICTLYAHASKLLVTQDDWVKAGEVIANVGTSGYTTGPHLHFEVYEGERTVNPLSWLQR